MRKPNLVTLSALLAGLAPGAAMARDASVERRLTEAGYTFKADADGDYLVVISYAQERRSQQVYVSGSTVAVNGVATRKVFSPASVGSKDPVSAAQALELLGANFRHGMGAWELNGGVLFLAIKLPDSVSAGELRAAIRAAAELADDREKQISGARDEL
jgi:hypothetical protein